MSNAPDVTPELVDSLLTRLPNGSYKRPYQTNTIEVSFLTEMPVYGGIDGASAEKIFARDVITGLPVFAQFTPIQKIQIRAAFDAISRVANVDFRFTDTPSPGAIRLGIADTLDKGLRSGGVNFKAADDLQAPRLNDIFMSVEQSPSYAFGTYEFTTIIHEICHALGLDKHPDAVTTAVSVMSYRHVLNPDGTRASPTGMTPLLLDVLALQNLWGKREDNLSGDTVYQFDPNSALAGTGNDDTTIYKSQVRALWDSGGSDTLKASDYAERVVINLQPGYLSSIGGNKNIAVAFNAKIENAIGGSGNDEISGNDLDNEISGGKEKGNDILRGGAGNDTYDFGRGDGQDTIVENDASADTMDTLHFEAGIDANQLWWRKTGNNLEVSVIGSSDKLTLSNWYLGAARHVEVFELANGQKLLDSQVQALVQAMASFSPPASGQTSLPANYQGSLDPVIAANWH